MRGIPMSRSVRIARTAAILGLLLVAPFAGTARADDDDEKAGSTYARVRYLEGKLMLERPGDGEVAQASVNSPLAPGDGAWTDEGRAEIELADGSVIRLDGGTRIDLRALSDVGNGYEKTNLIALEQGSLRIEASEPQGSDKVFQIDTDGGSVYLLSGGSFRIDAEGSVSTVSSFSGVAELSGDIGSVLVRSGERSSVRRAGSPTEPRPFNTLREDDFDRFNEDRGSAYLRHDVNQPIDQVQENVPREVDPYVGELSTYGDWQSLPEYGLVWRPSYAAGWGPYVNGEWVWYPTGWVWVSYDPWGWAPYHYGRWDFAASVGWFWIPGRVWSGAWVSFAVGPSYIGWCPLNFYNRPVFQTVNIVNASTINVTRLDARGWRFVPAGRFGAPRGDRTVLRPDRLPRSSEVVLTGRLPKFDPRGLAAHGEGAARLMQTVRGARQPLPAGADAADRMVPFRALERGAGRPRPEASRPPDAAIPRDRVGVRRDRPVPSGGGPSWSRGGSPAPRIGPSREGLSPSLSIPRDRERAMRPGQGAEVRRPPQEMRLHGQGPGPRPGEQIRPPGDGQARDIAPGEIRPRAHPVERLFDGVRRERPPVTVAPPPRAEPPRAEPRPSARSPQPRPRQPAARPARPPRPQERH